MALNFPSGVADGTVWTDPNGEQWVYNATENSWTSKGLVNNSGGLKYKGSIDITATAPAASGGDIYTVETGGTADASFTGLAGSSIDGGSVVIYDGVNWIEYASPGELWTLSGSDITPIDGTHNVLVGTTRLTKAGSIQGNGIHYNAGTGRLSVGADGQAPFSALQVGSSNGANGTSEDFLLFGKRNTTVTENNLPYIGQPSDRTACDLGIGVRGTNSALRFYTGNASAFTANRETCRIDKDGTLYLGASGNIASGFPDIKLVPGGTSEFNNNVKVGSLSLQGSSGTQTQVLGNVGNLVLHANDGSSGVVVKTKEGSNTSSTRFIANNKGQLGTSINVDSKCYIESEATTSDHSSYLNGILIKHSVPASAAGPVSGPASIKVLWNNEDEQNAISHQAGIRVTRQGNTENPNVQNYYGAYVDNVANYFGGDTYAYFSANNGRTNGKNHWGFYSGGSAPNYFKNTFFGSDPLDPTAKIFQNGDIRTSSSITIGSTSVTPQSGRQLQLIASADSDSGLIIQNGDSSVSNAAKASFDKVVTDNELQIKSSLGSGQAPISLFTNDSTRRMYIGTNGAIGIGTTAPDSTLHVKGSARVENNSGTSFKVSTKVGNANSASIALQKSRGGNSGPTPVQNSDNAGKFEFDAYLVDSYVEVASISSGITDISQPAGGGNLKFRVNGAERFRVQPNGDFGIGITTGTSAKLHVAGDAIIEDGLKIGGTDANVLGDYEEGTWIPRLAFDGTAVDDADQPIQEGSYTKIGRLVTVHGRLQCSTINTGDVTITNLPFQSASGTATKGGGVMTRTQQGVNDSGGPLTVRVVSSSIQVIIYRTGSNGLQTELKGSSMFSPFLGNFSFSYETDL